MKDKIAACRKSRTKTDVAALLVFVVLAGLFAVSALFCAHPFAGMLALNYYNITLMGFAVVCVILFSSETAPSRTALIFAGIAMSCAALCTPVSAVVYILYSAAVLTYRLTGRRRSSPRRFDSLFGGRIWMSAGIAICAAVFSR